MLPALLCRHRGLFLSVRVLAEEELPGHEDGPRVVTWGRPFCRDTQLSQLQGDWERGLGPGLQLLSSLGVSLPIWDLVVLCHSGVPCTLTAAVLWGKSLRPSVGDGGLSHTLSRFCKGPDATTHFVCSQYV